MHEPDWQDDRSIACFPALIQDNGEWRLFNEDHNGVAVVAPSLTPESYNQRTDEVRFKVSCSSLSHPGKLQSKRLGLLRDSLL